MDHSPYLSSLSFYPLAHGLPKIATSLFYRRTFLKHCRGRSSHLSAAFSLRRGTLSSSMGDRVDHASFLTAEQRSLADTDLRTAGRGADRTFCYRHGRRN